MNPNRYDWYEFMISLSRKPMEPSTRNLVMRQTRRITPQQVESIKTGAPRPQRERSNSRPGVRHVYPSYTKGQTVVQTKGRSIPLVPIELKNPVGIMLGDDQEMYVYEEDTNFNRTEELSETARNRAKVASNDNSELLSSRLEDTLYKLVPKPSFIPFTNADHEHLSTLSLAQFLDACDYIDSSVTVRTTASEYTRRLSRVFRQFLPWNNDTRLPDRCFVNGINWLEDTVINSMPSVVYDGIATLISGILKDKEYVMYVPKAYVGSSLMSFVTIPKLSQVIAHEADSVNYKIIRTNMRSYSYDTSRYIIINTTMDPSTRMFENTCLFLELEGDEDATWTLGTNCEFLFIVAKVPLEFKSEVVQEQFHLKIQDPFGDNVKGDMKEVYLTVVQKSNTSTEVVGEEEIKGTLMQLLTRYLPSMPRDKVEQIASDELWLTVFTHISYDPENNYEREELLGDALSLACFRDNILQTSKLNVAMVTILSTYYLKTLKQSEKAEELGLKNIIRSKVPIIDSILEDIMESFIAGLKLTSDKVGLDGYTVCKEFMYAIYVGTLECERSLTDIVTAVKQWFENAGIEFFITIEKVGNSSRFTGTLDKKALEILSIQSDPVTFTATDPIKKESKRKFYQQVYEFLMTKNRGPDYFAELRKKKSKIEKSEIRQLVENKVLSQGYKSSMVRVISRQDYYTYYGLYGDSYEGEQWNKEDYWGPMFKEPTCIPPRRTQLTLLSIGVGEDVNSAILSAYNRFLSN